eukprot:754187-Hanusia_phi.AAC.2
MKTVVYSTPITPVSDELRSFLHILAQSTKHAGIRQCRQRSQAVSSTTSQDLSKRRVPTDRQRGRRTT